MAQTYSDWLKSPEWQKKRLEIFERDHWTCLVCGDTENQLHCHHDYYEAGKKPWEYPNDAYFTLCETCHTLITRAIKAKLKAVLVSSLERFIRKVSSREYSDADSHAVDCALRLLDFAEGLDG